MSRKRRRARKPARSDLVFPELLTKSRRAGGFRTKAAFARRTEIHEETIGKLERGALRPSEGMVEWMAQVLDLAENDRTVFLAAAEHDRAVWDEVANQDDPVALPALTLRLLRGLLPLAMSWWAIHRARRQAPALEAAPEGSGVVAKQPPEQRLVPVITIYRRRAPQPAPSRLPVRALTRIAAGVAVMVFAVLLAVHLRPAAILPTHAVLISATATAESLATAIAQAPTPDVLYQVVTGAKPMLTDALTGQDSYHWTEVVTRLGGCKYGAGAYQAYVLGLAIAECYSRGMPSFPSTALFALQVDLNVLRGDGGGGLVFGYLGPGSPYYRFVVRPDGYFDLFDQTTRSRLSSAYAAPGQQQQQTVIVRGDIIYLYLGGIFMGQGALESGATVSGAIGLFAVDGSHNPTIVAFHRLKVWSIA